MTSPLTSFDRLSRRFLFVALALAAVLAVGTAGFMLTEGYSLFDAFYTTLLTMTTVGYGDTVTPSRPDSQFFPVHCRSDHHSGGHRRHDADGDRSRIR